MFTCCLLCYEKYVNEDGTIDWEMVNKITGPYSSEYKILLIHKGKICDCPCHVKGKAIVH